MNASTRSWPEYHASLSLKEHKWQAGTGLWESGIATFMPNGIMTMSSRITNFQHQRCPDCGNYHISQINLLNTHHNILFWHWTLGTFKQNQVLQQRMMEWKAWNCCWWGSLQWARYSELITSKHERLHNFTEILRQPYKQAVYFTATFWGAFAHLLQTRFVAWCSKMTLWERMTRHHTKFGCIQSSAS